MQWLSLLITRVIDGENPLTVWGDGSAIRDFIYSEDCARGMMLAVEKGINEPINLGSGNGVSIREVAEAVDNSPNVPGSIVWDKDKPSGDAKRLMDMSRASSYGFSCEVSIDEGIKETISWYIANRTEIDKRYNSFTDPLHLTQS